MKINTSIISDYMENVLKNFNPLAVETPVPGSIYAVSDMGFWYPAIKDIVRTPRTFGPIIPEVNPLLLLDPLSSLEKEQQEPEAAGLKKLFDEVTENAEKMGFPCFLRSGQTSAKHEWKHSCYLKSADDVKTHIHAITDISGCADLPLLTFWVRELIPTKREFTAFNGMPITREFRLFVEKGTVTHIQPYWPQKAFEREDFIESGWQEKLLSMSQIHADELEYLVKKTQEIGLRLPQNGWSVDWLSGEDGWFMIDMAHAAASFCWQPDFNFLKQSPSPALKNLEYPNPFKYA